MTRFVGFLPAQKQRFLEDIDEGRLNLHDRNRKTTQLDPVSHELLRQQILRRDVRSCGTMSNLEEHYQRFGSRSGESSEQNLITLFSPCHLEAHDRR